MSGDGEKRLGHLLREAVRLIESTDLRGANEILKRASVEPTLETGTAYREEPEATPAQATTTSRQEGQINEDSG